MAVIKNLSEVKDLEIMPNGEYDLRIISVKDGKSERTGRESINLTMKFVGEDAAKNLFHSIWLPMKGDGADKTDTMQRMIKEFCVGLNMDVDSDIETSDFKDLEFTALVDIEVSEEYGDKNIIKKVTS